MEPERWAEVEKLYNDLVDLDAAERDFHLAAISDPDLHHEVLSLLSAGPLSPTLGAWIHAGRDHLLEQYNTRKTLDAVSYSFKPGDLLASRYQITEFLGRGGMGEVYAAEDGDLGEKIAVKVIRGEAAQDKSWCERFRREVQLARRVTHPNVCRVFDIERHQQKGQETMFLTMELVRGETLAARLQRQGRLNIAEAFVVATQLCSALDTAHQAGILHRDLKCGNVMVVGADQHVRAVVTDFGTARAIDSSHTLLPTATLQSAIMGTPAYMSPEQLEGKELTAASDIYSLGLVLYEMVTGVRPFRTESPWVEAMKRLQEAPDPPSKIAPEIGENWNSTILGCLERDSGKRFSAAQQVAESLGVAGMGQPRAIAGSGTAAAGAVQEVASSPVPGPGPAGAARASEARAKWRRLAWKFAVPILACILLLVAWLWRQASFSGLRSQVMSASRLLAVVEIENSSDDRSLDWLGNVVVRRLTSDLARSNDLAQSNDLARSKSLGVISTERIRSLIRRRVPDDGRLPASQAQEVAEDAHADLFVSGALSKTASGLHLELNVQETDSGLLLFTKSVDANSQDIIAKVDRATVDILVRLAPDETGEQPNAGASLTSNIEALRAYEDAVDYKDRWLLDLAEPALRRAIELDPQFAMAHYQLAEVSRFKGDLATARQEVARADELALRLPLPRLQKLLIDAAQKDDDGRLQEAVGIWKTTISEFPKEPEPRMLLARALAAMWNLKENARALEELLDFDRRNPEAYNELASAYARLDNIPKALQAVYTYARLVPANDPNPIDTRGDVFSIGGRFEDAAAAYQKNLQLNPNFIFYPDLKTAVAYLSEGKYRLAEISARRARQRRRARQLDNQQAKAMATGVLGDIEAARGQLDKAAARYEDAARLAPKRDLIPSFVFERKAVEVYFEQGEPEQALALARRMPGPWAPGFSGMAYLLLKNDDAAEREFTRLRGSLVPLFGNRGADNYLILFRALAAFYGKRWQEVILRGSPMDDGRGSWLVVPALGRAYVEITDWENGERYLQRLAAMQRMSTLYGRDKGLAYFLSQFYLAKVFEHADKKVDAIHAYQEFLSHFENSHARLPQIAEARAALKRLM